ncbi:peptidoglycan-binding protein [Pseudogracilibacillus auburnensis]|uniref:Autolysin n=1 Tax=Pseudogracilibacillus auburnensis TaxID=1494959 RepID=A0A2V3VL11_9BACI|nr:peptidoglycan-binding protein [Pseudogracilibacillus auburnensis]PXW82506.1 N-acetylmuramoyl-L-alanine amidase [Pseudogracilibacillus auburnensis]
MSYAFQKLPQLVDHRSSILKNGSYSRRTRKITDRVWHHSLTKKTLGGSVAAAFARFHISLGWPGVGYAFIIEPQNVVKTNKGNRARIVYANDINQRTYHVGNSNQYSLGVCVAGDYRSDKLDDATKGSIAELHAALVADQIGNQDKSHHEMPGYSWKACCVYNYKEAFKFLNLSKPTAKTPSTYKIQEGDTFWGIAHNLDGISVEDLITANPKGDPKKLKVGQTINLGKAKNTFTRKPSQPKKPQSSYKYPLPSGILRNGSRGNGVKQLQRALNAIYFKCGSVDGILGPKTVDAIRRFQMVYLPYEVDGVYGPHTREKLQAVLKSKGY